MEKIPEITLYFKVGAIGMQDEVSETVTLTFDPRLTDEENMQMMQAKMALTQMKLQASTARFMIQLVEHIATLGIDES